MEALALPFMFTSMIVLWIAVEAKLRAQRRREALEADEAQTPGSSQPPR